MEFPKIIHWAIPVFVVAMSLELWWSCRNTVRQRSLKGGYSTPDTICSLSLGIGNVIIGLLGVKVFLWCGQALWAYRVWDLGASPWAIALCLCLDDFRYYWQHRLGHELRWVWAAHITHHSSQRYNLSTALRQSWTTGLTGIALLSAPLILLGFHPKLVLFCGSINLLYQFWIHTEAVDKMPRWFEYVFNTPSHHRVHHGKNVRYLDTNYGGIFILWDRIFGTFVPEDPKEPVQYGLTTDLESFNPFVAATHEWLGIAKDFAMPKLSLGQRIRYVVKRPGWSHDGSRCTSVQLKSQMQEKLPEADAAPDEPGNRGAA